MDAALLHEAGVVFGEAAVRKMHTPSPAAETVDEGEPDGEPILEAPSVVKLDMTPRQQRRLWHHVTAIDNFWQSLQEVEPGAVARLAQLTAERRWEIIFLTKRPQTAGVTAQVQSQRWLEAQGFSCPSVFVVSGSRGRIASALGLDVVVDDRPENCFDVVVDSHAKAILIWRQSVNTLPAAAQRLGVAVVPTVAECLNLLVSVDAPAADGESILARFKRLLGVKHRSDR
jgi:hypothetical protein